MTKIDRHIDSNSSFRNKERLREVLHSYSDIFIEDPKKPPEAKLVSHVIDTKNAQPTRDKLRRLPPKWAHEIEKQLEEMIMNGICRPSKSPWSSQVLLSKKKDGSMRFVIDYRKLNNVTIRDEYPMPNIKDLIDELEGSEYFSCMDLPSAYWHIPMDTESISKTAFEVPRGKFEMLRMPYGLRNSQATQQRHMDNVLGGVKNTSTYVDNILTHSPSEDEHLNILEECFKRIREHNLSLRLDKCDFGKKEVEQFGFVVNKKGI